MVYHPGLMKPEKDAPALYLPDPQMRPAPPLMPWALGDTPIMPPLGTSPVVRMPVSDAEPPRNGRVRVNRACLRCRSHKIKCTGTYPCTNCTKNNEECRYGKDEPPAKVRRTLPEPHAYTEYLESRVRQLEGEVRRLMDAGAGIESDRLDSRTEGPDLDPEGRTLDPYGRSFDPELDPRTAGRADPRADAKPDKDARKNPPAWQAQAKWRMVDRPQLALVTELCRTVHAGLSDTAKAHVSVPRRQFFGWNMSGCHYLRQEPFPPEVAMPLSPAQRAAYVDYFFRDINPLFAIVHETVFREQMSAAETDAATTNFTVLFRAMLCLVYALSIRFTEFVGPEGPRVAMLRLEEDLFQYGHRVVLLISFEWELFELIQCWLLITLYLRTTHRQTSAFTALGRAVHMCRVMGLGRPPRLPHVPPYEALKARRIFECVYCFDRVVGYFGGRRRSFPAADIRRRAPLLDFAAESDCDDWITLPAFAMIHIGRVANLIPLGERSDTRTAVIDRELAQLDQWLRDNGFGDDIFADAQPVPPDLRAADGAPAARPQILPAVRAQVRFHFCDLVLAVHGQVLFSILGRPVPCGGMRLDRVRRAALEIVALAQGLRTKGMLYVPWFTTLNLVFHAGICSLVLLQASVAVHEARRVLAGAMSVLQLLQDLPVYEDGKMLFFERFKMVRECMWALKTANHIVSLGFSEAAQGLRDLGIDHGNSDVNRQYFSQFGLVDAPAQSQLDKLAHDQSRRGFEDRKKVAALISDPATDTTFSQPNLGDGGNEIIESLRWFDNWLDFGEAP